MNIHPSTRARFHRIVPALLEWHRENRRSFIWRGLKRTPYIVMVSEFMLQQTGAKQVEKHLPEFLRKFPTVKALANASRPEVIRAWHGLGYNRRAINLHLAAKAIAKRRSFPKGLDGLLELPGIGRYTASAILCFAYNKNVPVVDVNIERVLSRLSKRMPDAHAILSVRELYALDEAILPTGQSSNWHEAVMDLGSAICTKNAPKCEACPIESFCPSARRLKAPAKERRIREAIYFGQPRRIWRGRILREVARAAPVREKQLIAGLRNTFVIQDGKFVGFVRSVLSMLRKEGFLTKTTKGYLCLAEHE